MSNENTIDEENIEITIKEDDKPKVNKKKKNDECIELKNIQYKTMLLNGVQKELKASKTEEDIENILEKEKNLNLSVPWTKLEKGTKIKKLVAFSEKYGIDNKLSKDEVLKLKTLLKNAIDRKHLQRMKDITYDKETGTIIDIPLLSFDQETRNFILRRQEKKSTQKSFTPYKRKTGKGKTSKQTKQSKNSKATKSGKATRTKVQKEKKTTHNKTSRSPPAKTLKKGRGTKMTVDSD